MLRWNYTVNSGKIILTFIEGPGLKTQQHHQYLQRALALAATRRGYCAPNPAVGAVIAREGKVLSEGVHWAAGQPHAEAVALAALAGQAVGATLYVSLEPCCHQGRTPPCTDAILAAGITQVVYGFLDPNPVVAGQGARQLALAGVETVHLSLPECVHFYQSYQHWHRQQRPWVTAKIALSLDGKIAGPGGERLAITGPALKQHTYRCRQRSDAILTTAKTIQQDNPTLDIKLGEQVESKRLYILDRSLQLTADYTIWQNTQPITVFYAAEKAGTLNQTLVQQGVRFIAVPEAPAGLDLAAILQIIGAEGVHDLWVEAGGRLLSSLLAADRVDQLQLYTAPTWLGASAQDAFSDQLLNFAQFPHKHWQQVGDDALCEMSRTQPEVEALCLPD